MPMRWDEQRLTDVTAEAGRVRARRDEVASRLWDMSPQNRDNPPTEAEDRQHAELVTEHAFLARRLEDLEREQQALETARPVETPNHLQPSVVARFNAGGLAQLSADERNAHRLELGGQGSRNGVGDGSMPPLVRHRSDLEGIRLPAGANNAEVIVVPLAAIAPPRTEYRPAVPQAAAPGIRPDQADGGELWTPVQVYPEVGERLASFGGIEQGCSMWMSPDGVTARIPTSDDSDQKGEIFGTVAGPVTTQEVEIGNREMKTSVGSSKKMNLSIWMEGDTPINVDGMYRNYAWRRLGRAWAEQWINGDGQNDKPRGIMTDATLGKDFAGELGPTGDELMDLVDSIDIAYLQGEGGYYGMAPPGGGHRGFLMHQSELREIRKTKGSDGHYLWLPDLGAGDRATILGYPYIVDNDMTPPPAAADADRQNVLAFGNFGEYLIRKAPMAFLVRFWDSGTAGTMSYQYMAFNRCWGRFMGGFPNLAADAVECVKYGRTVA